MLARKYEVLPNVRAILWLDKKSDTLRALQRKFVKYGKFSSNVQAHFWSVRTEHALVHPFLVQQKRGIKERMDSTWKHLLAKLIRVGWKTYWLSLPPLGLFQDKIYKEMRQTSMYYIWYGVGCTLLKVGIHFGHFVIFSWGGWLSGSPLGVPRRYFKF